MIWSLFAPSGRFQKLLKGARKLQTSAAAVAMVALLALSPQNLNAASPTIDEDMLKTMQSYDAEHARNFGKIAVQDHQGRMKPMDTVAHDVIAKITGRSVLFDLEPTQMLLGMIMQPELYQNVPMIKVGQKAPDFEAPAFHKGEFASVKLSDLLGQWVVLCFYPGDFTFV